MNLENEFINDYFKSKHILDIINIRNINDYSYTKNIYATEKMLYSWTHKIWTMTIYIYLNGELKFE